MRRILSLCLCLILALGIAGCSTATTAPTTKSPASTTPAGTTVAPTTKGTSVSLSGTTITYLNSHGPQWEGEPGLGVIAKFKAKTGIIVKSEAYPFDQYFEIITVKMASKLADHDVFNVDVPMTTGYAMKGYMASFEDYVPRSILEKTFLKSDLEAGSYKGVLYAVPKTDSGMIMVYNKDILQAKGIPFPANDPAKRMTWEECLEIAKKVTVVSNGATSSWGIVLDQINRVWNVMPLANSNGAKWLSEDGLVATGYINSEKSIAAMQFYADLFNKHGVSPKGIDTNEGRALFETGKCAFTFGDPGCYARAKKAGINVGICPVPAFKDGKPAVGVGSWHASINAYSTKKDAAAEFLKYITMDEGNDIFLDAQSKVGARFERLDNLTKPSNALSELFITLKYDLVNSPAPRPKTPGYLEWQDFVNKAIEDIRNGANVKTSLDNAATLIDAAMKKYSR